MIGEGLMTHGKFRLPWVTLSTAAMCLGLFAAFGGTPEALVYDRDLIAGGEWWRLVTGHLVHLNLQHLAFNCGALLALGVLYETARFGGPGRLAVSVLGLGVVAVSAALYLGDPGTASYCGLSAVLNTLYVAVTIGMWRERGDWFWLAMFGLGAAKIAWEAVAGPVFSSALPWPPHIGAHVAGILAGGLALIASSKEEAGGGAELARETPS